MLGARKDRFQKKVHGVGKAKKRKPKDKFFIKKSCRFCRDKIETMDYKDVTRLRRFVTEKGKLLPGRITGNCARHQRAVVIAVKRARYIALLPFVGE